MINISIKCWQRVPKLILITHRTNVILRQNNGINQHIFDFNYTEIYIMESRMHSATTKEREEKTRRKSGRDGKKCVSRSES
jgi:hypothetical protein